MFFMNMKKDPVCGMDVSGKTGYTTLHGGRKLYFCSSECRNDFLHNPDKYMEKMTEEKGKKAA
jgi:Cu+-exporting ATPase